MLRAANTIKQYKSNLQMNLNQVKMKNDDDRFIAIHYINKSYLSERYSIDQQTTSGLNDIFYCFKKAKRVCLWYK